ncbi:MAG: glycosyltransferase [Bacteroidota bacterium]
MPRVLAVIVLYFPARPPATLTGEVDDILVIDNTGNNIGVAAALNLGLKKAIDEKFDWLLTMDQDSVFEHGALAELKKVAFTAKDNIAIVSPFHLTAKAKRKSIAVEEVRFTMTSGNLVRPGLGFFEEKLFIDSVDNEYCLRLRKNGYKIIRVNQAVLNHHLGTLKKNWLGFSTIVHPASRRYYITRNMLYVMSKYPEFILFGLKELIKSFVLILLVEDDKINKLKAMIKGFRNARL